MLVICREFYRSSCSIDYVKLDLFESVTEPRIFFFLGGEAYIYIYIYFFFFFV